MNWEVIAILAAIAVLYIGYKRRKSYVGEFIIGILYGFWWEFTAEALFNYTNFSIYLWRDVPLAIILLWGVSIAGFIMISDYLQDNYPIWKRGKFKKLKNSLVFDVSVATFFGWAMEYSGSHFLGMWTYPATGLVMFAGVPIKWLAGWIFVGVFILAFVRRYQELFEIKKWEWKLEHHR